MAAKFFLKEHEIATLRQWWRAIRNYRATKDGIIAVGTVFTTIATILLSLFALRQASITADQLASSRLEQRPWIAIEVDTSRAIFDLEEGGLIIILQFKLRNTGHQPARGVFVITQGWADPPHSVEEAKNRQNSTCREGPAFGWTVFPGQVFEQPGGNGTYVSWQEIDKISPPQPKEKKRPIYPYMIACVTYEDLDGAIHYTPLPLDLGGSEFGLPIDVSYSHFAGQGFSINPSINARMDPN